MVIEKKTKLHSEVTVIMGKGKAVWETDGSDEI